MSIESSPIANRDCLITSASPTLCLRLETPRERLALPYAGLVSMSLSVDDTTMAIVFVTHRVTIKGRKLYPVYSEVAAGSAHGLVLGRRMELPKPEHHYHPSQPPEAPREIYAIVSIRIESVEVAS
ncbi:MAG: hypothetical protein PSV13_06800 [Lacunisphaera sp.]|nr:hypothetical protein [Lacunisphaera sp.]